MYVSLGPLSAPGPRRPRSKGSIRVARRDGAGLCVTLFVLTLPTPDYPSSRETGLFADFHLSLRCLCMLLEGLIPSVILEGARPYLVPVWGWGWSVDCRFLVGWGLKILLYREL